MLRHYLYENQTTKHKCRKIRYKRKKDGMSKLVRRTF